IAAGAAFELVRRTELLLDHWGTHPPSMLRGGGLGVRDLRAAAVHLHVDEPTAALVVETAAAAGLLSERADADGAPAWVPTDALAPDLAGPTMVETRLMALQVLAELPPGEVLAAGTGVPSLVSAVAWRRPRRPRIRDEQVAWTAGEAAVLGLTGAGGLATYAR